jgi:hypothetical protein
MDVANFDFIVSEINASHAVVKAFCSYATVSRRFAIHSWQMVVASDELSAFISLVPKSDSI